MESFSSDFLLSRPTVAFATCGFFNFYACRHALLSGPSWLSLHFLGDTDSLIQHVRLEAIFKTFGTQVVSVAFALQWKTDTHTLSVLGFDLDISAQAEETRGISICSLPTKSPWSVLTAAFLPDTGLYWKRFAALGK